MSINDIEIQCGLHMQQLGVLEESASLVSSWLTKYAPNTKPKPANVLVTDFAESYYASIDGILAGHIALSPLSEPLNVSSEFVFESLNYSELAHYGIGSLVVRSQARGHGIGGLLLDNACSQVINKLTEEHNDDTSNNHRRVLVSAIAASTSLSMFLARGFSPDPELEYSFPYSDIGYDPLSGKTIVSRIFSL